MYIKSKGNEVLVSVQRVAMIRTFSSLQYQEEEFEEWVRQVNEEFEQVDKHELFVTSTLQDS